MCMSSYCFNHFHHITYHIPLSPYCHITYRLPSSSTLFKAKFFTLLEDLISSPSELIISGNFNFHVDDPTSPLPLLSLPYLTPSASRNSSLSPLILLVIHLVFSALAPLLLSSLPSTMLFLLSQITIQFFLFSC